MYVEVLKALGWKYSQGRSHQMLKASCSLRDKKMVEEHEAIVIEYLQREF